MKQILFLALLATRAPLDFADAKAADSVAEGLVANWNFDEPSGTNIVDGSSNKLAGHLRGATRVAGKLGGGIECGQDALVEVPHAPALDHFENGMTVTAWIKRSPDASWNTVVSREIKSGPSEYFGLAVVKNKALFSVDIDGAHYKNIKSDEDMPVGEWVHLAGTYDNSAFKLYVNGRLVKTGASEGAFHFADQNPLIIGGNTNTEGAKWVDCFHGQIDEVRIYKRALDEKEIAALK